MGNLLKWAFFFNKKKKEELKWAWHGDISCFLSGGWTLGVYRL